MFTRRRQSNSKPRKKMTLKRIRSLSDLKTWMYQHPKTAAMVFTVLGSATDVAYARGDMNKTYTKRMLSKLKSKKKERAISIAKENKPVQENKKTPDANLNTRVDPGFQKGQQVIYTNAKGKRELVTIVDIHHDDMELYYTIHLPSTNCERQTTLSKLKKKIGR